MKLPSRALDITGKRYGRLLVIEPIGLKERRGVIWRCLCDCDNEHDVVTAMLQSGNTLSCGCLRGDRIAKDISGQRFGRLVAIEFTGRLRGSERIWAVECDCRNLHEASISDLISGKVQSCGCLLRETSAELGKARATHGQSQTYKYKRNRQLVREYGISLNDFEVLLEKQGGKCAICGDTNGDRSLCVDHCHSSGKIRGLLCDRCNQALGLLQHDRELLNQAREYLDV